MASGGGPRGSLESAKERLEEISRELGSKREVLQRIDNEIRTLDQ